MAKGLTTKLLRAALLCGTFAPAVSISAVNAVAQERLVEFNISGGALGDVLTQIGAASSSSISFSPAAVEGLRSDPIVGRMSVAQAVARALGGSKLRAVLNAEGTWTVVGRGAARAPGGGSTATDIPDVEVSGNGYADGSSDPLATQGTHTFAATDANIATKSPLSIKETPQSVSVVTAQQIEDQHLTTLDQAVEATPGLISATGSGPGQSNISQGYYSRGFEITSFSIDGGSPIQSGGGMNGFAANYISTFDLSEFDSIAVLRGSGGQYSGTGDPGGTLSLERKRPLDHESASIDQTFGSFDSFRTVGDINTGELWDGHLRIRSTFANDGQHYFYEFAKKYVDQIYLNAELNLTPTTLVNLGGSYNNTRANPWLNGLPTYNDGTFPNFPRSICLCAPWGTTTIGSQEYFLQVKQDLGPDWHLHFNSSLHTQSADNNDLNYEIFNGSPSGLASGSNSGATFSAGESTNKETQRLADLYVNGHLSPFGILVEPTFGGSIQYIADKYPATDLQYTYNTQSLDLTKFNGSATPAEPLSQYTPEPVYDIGTSPDYSQRQVAGYGSLRLSPVSWAHLLVAERVSLYDQNISKASGGETTGETLHKLHVPLPDVGLTFDLTHETSIYGSYSTIYQLQNSLATPDGQLVGPIQGATWKGGIKRSDFGGRLTSSVAYYHASETGLAVPNPNYSFSQLPGSLLTCCYIADGTKYDSQGLDVEVTGKVFPNVDLTLSYNYNDNTTTVGSLPELTQSGTTNPGNVSQLNFLFPRHIAKVFAVVTPETGIGEIDRYARRLKLGGGFELKSETSNSGQYNIYTFSGGQFQQTVQTYKVSQPLYTVFNAMVRYDLTEKAYAQLNVYNMFDKKYFQTIGTFGGGNWYGQPLTLAGSLHVAF
jgi:outer membrane receptor for ferric coprogen and ferric-rhodotorulic acid